MLGCKGGDGDDSKLTVPAGISFPGLKALQYNSTIPFSIKVETTTAMTVNLVILYKDGVSGAFQPATSEPGRPDPTGVQGLKVPSGGTTFNFWWHAIADLDGGENHNAVYLKAVITEPNGRITEAMFGPMRIDYTTTLGGVLPPYVAGGPLPSAYCGLYYDAQMQVQGGYPPFEWTLLPVGIQLPYFLEITYDGHIRGTIPAGYGPVTISFTARIVDSNPIVRRESAGDFTIFVDCEPIGPGCGPAPMINFVSLPAANEEAAYIYNCTATGGDGVLTWSILEGEFPDFLELTADGLISGTPPVGSAGAYPFTVQVCDSCEFGPQCDTQEVTLVVNEPTFECDDPPAITTQSLPNAKEGAAYNQQLLAAGGHGDNLNWAIIDGTPPDGVQISSDGVLSGTPAAGTGGTTGELYVLTFQVCDECPTGPQCDTKELGLTVTPGDIPCEDPPTITTESPITSASEGIEYSFQFEAEGGDGQLRWILNDAGELTAAGLMLGENGVLSGTPNEGSANTLTLDITVEDSCPVVQSDNEMFLFTINAGCAPAPTISTTGIEPAVEGLAYSFQFEAMDGEGDLTWTKISGPDWPAGLTLAESGLLSGTVETGAAALSPYSGLEIQVTDSCFTGPQTASNLFNMDVYEPCADGPLITTIVVPGAGIGLEYNFTFEATGGEGALSWALDTDTGDALPDGLLFSDGTISGIPLADTDGTYNLVPEVCDSCPVAQCDSKPYELEVSVACAPAPVITTTVIDVGLVGESYSFQFEATGGEGTLTWKIGNLLTLPAGFFMSIEGLLTGEPTIGQIGQYNIDVIVEDTCWLGAQSDIQPFTLTIENEGCMPAPEIITPVAITYSAGSGVDLRFMAQFGEGALTWTLLDATPGLPGTVAFGADGSLRGITELSDAGTYLLDVEVCDECTDPGIQCTTMMDFELILDTPVGCGSGPPVIQDLTIPTPTSDGSPYSYTMTVTGGDGSVLWASAGLPESMFIDPVSGEIQGEVNAEQAGTYRVIIWAQDSCIPTPQADSVEYIWNIL